MESKHPTWAREDASEKLADVKAEATIYYAGEHMVSRGPVERWWETYKWPCCGQVG
jgi:superfamily II DNA helicase RecQ